MKFDSKNDVIQQEEAINYKKIIYQLMGHWYWLLLFGALGLGKPFNH